MTAVMGLDACILEDQEKHWNSQFVVHPSSWLIQPHYSAELQPLCLVCIKVISWYVWPFKSALLLKQLKSSSTYDCSLGTVGRLLVVLYCSTCYPCKYLPDSKKLKAKFIVFLCTFISPSQALLTSLVCCYLISSLLYLMSLYLSLFNISNNCENLSGPMFTPLLST